MYKYTFVVFFIVIGWIVGLNIIVRITILHFGQTINNPLRLTQVGTIIDRYLRKLNEDNPTAHLADDKKKYLHALDIASQAKPTKAFHHQGCWAPMAAASKVTSSNMFAAFMLLVALTDTVFLCLAYYRQTEDRAMILEVANGICLGLYAIEMLLRLFAMGRRFFFSHWNRFDLVVVVTSAVDLIVEGVRFFRVVRGRNFLSRRYHLHCKPFRSEFSSLARSTCSSGPKG